MKKWLWLGGVAIALLFGFAVCEFLRLRAQGRISYSLDFGSLLEAIVLLVVLVSIDYAYSKQSSKKRADADLLLAIVAEARVALRKVDEASQSCEQGRALRPKEQQILNLAARDLSNAVHSVEKALSYCDCDLGALKFEKVKDARVEVKDALTDTPYPGPYDRTSLNRIRTALKTMADELTRITFAINNR